MTAHPVARQRWSRAVLAAAVAAAVAGCGGGGGTDAPTSPPTSSPAPTAFACTSDSPFAVRLVPAWAGIVSMCEYPSLVEVVNDSTTVLLLSPRYPSSVEVTFAEPQHTLEDDAVDALVDSAAPTPTGFHRLRPGATATVSGSGGAAGVYLEVESLLTAQVYATRAATGYIQSKLTTRTDALVASAAECGRTVGEMWASDSTGPLSPSVEEVLISSIQTGLACRRMSVTVHQELVRPIPSASTLASEVREASRGLGATLVDDALDLARRAVSVVR